MLHGIFLSLFFRRKLRCDCSRSRNFSAQKRKPKQTAQNLDKWLIKEEIGTFVSSMFFFGCQTVSFLLRNWSFQKCPFFQKFATCCLKGFVGFLRVALAENQNNPFGHDWRKRFCTYGRTIGTLWDRENLCIHRAKTLNVSIAQENKKARNDESAVCTVSLLVVCSQRQANHYMKVANTRCISTPVN